MKMITASQFKPIAQAFGYTFVTGQKLEVNATFHVEGEIRLGESSEALATCAALKLETVARLLERVGCTGPAALRLAIEALKEEKQKAPLSDAGKGFVAAFRSHVATNLPPIVKSGPLTGKLALEQL